jgi:hypothetical protein
MPKPGFEFLWGIFFLIPQALILFDRAGVRTARGI